MKFDEYLAAHAIERWRRHYVDYTSLKRILTRGAATADAGKRADASAQFLQAMQGEIARLNRFVAAQAPAASASDAAAWALSRDLADFAHVNRLALHKLAQKHDSALQLHHAPALIAGIEAASFVRSDSAAAASAAPPSAREAGGAAGAAAAPAHLTITVRHGPGPRATAPGVGDSDGASGDDDGDDGERLLVHDVYSFGAGGSEPSVRGAPMRRSTLATAL